MDLSYLPKGFAVDIDETIGMTVFSFLEAMSREFGNPESLPPEFIYERYGLAQNVPYPEWKTPKAKAWIREACDNNAIHLTAPVIPGSLDVLRDLHVKQQLACFLTVRGQCLVETTNTWIDHHGFPKLQVIARPDAVSHKEGDVWKARILADNFPHITGIIDNSARVIGYLPPNYQGTVIHFGATEKVRDDLPKLIACKDWQAVELAIQRGRTHVIPV